MKKKELLAPVGNYESLVQAVQNGADAVYLAGQKFGARAFANNFTNEELIQAIKYCHLYGVKIYVTVNTLIYESEIEDCLEFIRFLHQHQVDAVILQDLGLIKIVREKFPNLEIHASTQMHNHNQEQLKLYEKLGIKRVVLARELSLEEINSLDTSLELEVFIHGALCICYSGECLFSSLLLNRSGNRGSCAQICRLPFTLYEDEKKIETNGQYLLSPKELCTIEEFNKIMESNIYSLKIEGRMKSPYYVGFITRLYRRLIDSKTENQTFQISENDYKNLQVLFNRGFTKGYLFNDKNEGLMNIKTSNHQGIPLGVVLQVNHHKIKIKLSEDLHQYDGIRFTKEDKGMIVNFLYNEKDMLINHANKGDIVYVDNKIGLESKCQVLKTQDYLLENSLKKLSQRKINIVGKLICQINQPLTLILDDKENTVKKVGSVVSSAKNQPLTEDVIKEKVMSLGNTPFYLEKLDILLDENCFVNLKELKELRREAIQNLTEIRENKISHIFSELALNEEIISKPSKDSESFIRVSVETEEQLLACLQNKVDSIYVSDENLYNKYKKENIIYLKLARVKKDFKEYKDEKLVVEETGSLFKYARENEIIGDYALNIANSYSYLFLEDYNVKRMTLSLELCLNETENFLQKVKDKEKIEIYVYGRPDVMIMKHCPLNMLVNKEKKCQVCQNNHQYFLKDRNNKLYPIKSNSRDNHLTRILYFEPIARFSDLGKYKQMGIRNFRLDFFEETPEEIKSILSKIKNVKYE